MIRGEKFGVDLGDCCDDLGLLGICISVRCQCKEKGRRRQTNTKETAGHVTVFRQIILFPLFGSFLSQLLCSPFSLMSSLLSRVGFDVFATSDPLDTQKTLQHRLYMHPYNMGWRGGGCISKYSGTR